MRRFLIILVLGVTAGMAVFIINSESLASPVESVRVLSIPGRGHGVEIQIRNDTGHQATYYFRRQQLFNGHWAPEVSPHSKADEVLRIAAGGRGNATLRVHDSGGRFRIHVLYAKPPRWHQRLLDRARKSLGWRTKPVPWRREMILTEPIEVPPV